jgi:cell division transport system permease protein
MFNQCLTFINRYKFLILKSSLPLSLILLIGFAFLLVGYNLQEAAQGLEGRYSLEIFLRNEATANNVDTLTIFLRHQPAFFNLEIVTQQDALDKMSNLLDEDLVDVLGYNPLPMSVIFYPSDSYKSRSYLEILKKQVEEFPFVEKGVFAGEWLQELEQFNSIFIKITSAFLILVLIAYILLFHMILNHLWLKHQQAAGKLHLLGMSRLQLRLPVYIWSLLMAFITSLLGLMILGIAAGLVSDYFIKLKFFQPQQVLAIIISFTIISLLFTIFKRMKIPAYE